MDREQTDKLRRLVSLYADDGLDNTDLAALSEMLSGSIEAREAYIDLITTHTELMLLCPFESRTELPDNIATDSVAPDNKREILPDPNKVSRSRTWMRYGLVGLAASMLTIVAYQGLVIPNRSPTPFDLSAVDALPPEDKSVARITRKVDCEWEDDQWTVVSSAKILPGQTLSLTRGLMELEFTSGARVTLEAPVSFTVESALRGILSRGKLLARVPDTAHGFTVSTPGGDTIDLGTEFGLVVGKDGATETHVFDGEVVVHPRDTGAKNKNVHLTDDMAIRLKPGQDQHRFLDAVAGRFANLEIKEQDAEIKPVVDRRLSLWFSADQRIQVDEAGGVAAWGDLLSESNRTAQNAWQVEPQNRPQWVDQAIDGQPAVRFTSETVMVTEPLELGSVLTVVVVFQADLAELGKHPIGEVGRHLINTNGRPHLSLKIDAQGRLVSQSYAGFRTDADGEREHIIAGYMNWQELDAHPVIAITVYDPSVDSSFLYINGVQVARSTAPRLKPTNSPRYIGKHPYVPNTNFIGDIAELMIYETGLTAEEISTLSQSLMAKYSIGIGSTAD